MRAEHYWNASFLCHVGHFPQDVRANAAILKLRQYDQLADVNVRFAVFNAGITARNAITQNYFESCGIPAFSEEPVLSLFIPGLILSRNDIPIGLMMHFTRKGGVVIVRLSPDYFQSVFAGAFLSLRNSRQHIRVAMNCPFAVTFLQNGKSVARTFYGRTTIAGGNDDR